MFNDCAFAGGTSAEFKLANGRRKTAPERITRKRALSLQEAEKNSDLLAERTVQDGRDTIPTGTRPEPAPSALAAWLRDAGQVPLLTLAEEVQLAAAIKQGDEAARERMVRANLRLVAKIARDYEHLGLPLVDLLSEGAIGLMKAVEKFDPAKGGKMSTYSSWWIKQQIRRAIANQGRTIRLPVHVEAKIYRLGLAELKMREVLGREATDEELADELSMDSRRLARLRAASVRQSSLDAPAGEDGDSTIADLVADERATTPSELFERETDRTLAAQLLERLPQREAEILRSRFGLNDGQEQTLEEIGSKMRVTRERIRQLQNEALKKLRALMEERRLAA